MYKKTITGPYKRCLDCEFAGICSKIKIEVVEYGCE